MKKPKYIKVIENKDEIMSSIKISFITNDIDTFISKRKFELVWSESEIISDDSKIKFIKKIYKTKQNFYLYILTKKEITSVIIFYKQVQLNELTIFVRQLLKQFKNDTNIMILGDIYDEKHQ
jgi:hypothetical protein